MRNDWLAPVPGLRPLLWEASITRMSDGLQHVEKKEPVSIKTQHGGRERCHCFIVCIELVLAPMHTAPCDQFQVSITFYTLLFWLNSFNSSSTRRTFWYHDEAWPLSVSHTSTGESESLTAGTRASLPIVTLSLCACNKASVVHRTTSRWVAICWNSRMASATDPAQARRQETPARINKSTKIALLWKLRYAPSTPSG